jgi:hypothetical protein
VATSLDLIQRHNITRRQRNLLEKKLANLIEEDCYRTHPLVTGEQQRHRWKGGRNENKK